jgi:alpha-glucoside transport system ATP-binding protein
LYERPENEFVAQFIGSPAMNLLPGKIIETGAQTKVAFDGGGTAISGAPSVAGDMGAAVNVGVRPEDLVQSSGDYIFEGKVDFVEALGEVTLLYMETVGSDTSVIGKLAGTHKDMRGQGVRFSAVPEKVQVFKDGQSLYYA